MIEIHTYIYIYGCCIQCGYLIYWVNWKTHYYYSVGFLAIGLIGVWSVLGRSVLVPQYDATTIDRERKCGLTNHRGSSGNDAVSGWLCGDYSRAGIVKQHYDCDDDRGCSRSSRTG